ncbi:hypothetical protein LINPERPRIM_LOCUS10225 [Linum perenne]
MSWTSSSWET